MCRALVDVFPAEREKMFLINEVLGKDNDVIFTEEKRNFFTRFW